MYVPPAFKQSDLDACHGLIEANGFGTLVSPGAGAAAPNATHIPFLLDRTRGPNGTLIGHMARANPHRELLGAEALVIFQGPHAYVSPSWYEASPAVPTWNYLAVHAYGTPKIIDDPARVRATLARLTEVHEAGRSPAWQFESLPGDFVDEMVRGIVAFEIPIVRLEGKWKLSQNRSPADRNGVIQGLRAQDDPMPRAVAEVMAQMMDGG
ncbi:MAG: FMN-binding negative transcriptional regulator [Proteobacteria bacterium]|nr:FMN-binding negative transcriptional regulator [Pseudomonadota bacterium]